MRSITVSIPFKRESLSKDYFLIRTEWYKLCFNSLQTGKPIQSEIFWHPHRLLHPFQFPSNGKAYPKENTAAGKRALLDFKFQFPSNGKAYPKKTRVATESDEIGDWVSIPFKRESLSKDSEVENAFKASEFQFPSNGKAYPKEKAEVKELLETIEKFQFPSNGKAYPKVGTRIGYMADRHFVSIPFKRESLSKGYALERLSRVQGRVSIPFKRESLSKGGLKLWGNELLHGVSIPFKRESLSKGRH